MTPTMLQALLPLLITVATALVIMLAIAIRRDHLITVALAILGLLGALVATVAVTPLAPLPVTALLIVDRYSLFFTGLVLAAGLVIILLAYGYFTRLHESREEFYLLLVLALAGALVLVSSAHFVSFFLGVELLSISLYAMIAYRREAPESVEAGLKYLILAGVSSSILLFGMALVYADLGTMRLPDLTDRMLTTAGLFPSVLSVVGFLLIIVGIGFKLALTPFHLWAPDVYQGAPLPVTALITTVSKGAVFAVLLRIFPILPANINAPIFTVLMAIALLSMLVGNLLALKQANLKRLLAYSSIAQMGYILVAVLAGSATAVAFFLTAYFITILGAFGVMTLLSGADGEKQTLAEYRGLAWRHPWLTAILTAAMLSLAGIPLTSGFIGKFLVLNAGVGAGMWALVLVLVLSSGIGLYYYLRVVTALFQSARADATLPPPPVPALPALGGVALAVLVLLLAWLGVYPAPFIHLITTMLGQS